MNIVLKTEKEETFFYYKTLTKIRNSHTKRDGTIKENATGSPMFS
jgi:hypothetical protein